MPRRSARLAGEAPSLETSTESLEKASSPPASKRSNGPATVETLNAEQSAPSTEGLAPIGTEVGSAALSNGGDVDLEADVHHSYEFGGPLGVTGMLVFFPCLLYYLWGSLMHNDACLLPLMSRKDPTSLEPLRHIVSIARTHARPTPEACALYLGFVALQLFLAAVVPGYMQEGLPVASLRGKRLLYKCNALYSCYITYAIVAALHFSGTLRLPILIDRFGEIMTVAIITSFALAAICYVVTKQPVRMSGNIVYDYFSASGARLSG